MSFGMVVMTISIIVAFARENRVIGAKGMLPWSIKEDLARFKSITMGHCCVVGFTTFAKLPVLKGRYLIVLSKHHKINTEYATSASSMEEAICIAKERGETELFCIGGEQTYEVFLPYTDRIYITEVFGKYEGDAFFPSFDENKYILKKEESLNCLIFKVYEKNLE